MSFAHPFYTPAILALAGGCHAVVAQRVCIREIRCRSPIKLSFWETVPVVNFQRIEERRWLRSLVQRCVRSS